MQIKYMFSKGRQTGFALALLLVLHSSCKKFVQVPVPENQLASGNVFASDASATSAMAGVYSNMIGSTFASGGSVSVTLLAGLSADELTNASFSSDQASFGTNTLLPTNGDVASIWQTAYSIIYSSNAVLQGVANSSGVSNTVAQELTGEAKFVRAFCYFYLTNLYGAVPLDTTTTYQTNSVAPRSPQSDINKQVVTDLLSAQGLLAGDYSFSNGERVRPNQWAATALLSRVYLYEGDWSDAVVQATAVINNTALYSLDTALNTVFLANSTEAIWQLEPNFPGMNTQEGSNFILTADPGNVSLSSWVVNAFEANDKRRSAWVGTYTDGTNTWYFPYKYKIQYSSTLTEYSMVLRLAEQYLIRAEASAQNGNFSGATADLNIIRGRAGLANDTLTSKSAALAAIYHERQVELFTEWGHRWLDLIRSGLASSVLSPIKPGWNNNDTLYPIPITEIQNNPEASQNPGY